MSLHVSRMTADSWNGVLCDEVETSTPTVSEMESAVDALDAKVRTIVCLHSPSGAQLTIGGGAGQYVVYGSTPDEQLWNLIADSGGERSGVVILNAGGQEGDFPARQVVARPAALRAVRTFGETGKLDPTLHWEEQA